MDQKEFVKIRKCLGKSQSQLAQLLSISNRALQSYEQGWRNVPSHVERQVLFLLATKKAHNKQIVPCWMMIKCPIKIRNKCSAWELQVGHLCWFIGGTLCHGEVQTNWQNKVQTCRSCEVFHSMFPLLKKTTKK